MTDLHTKDGTKVQTNKIIITKETVEQKNNLPSCFFIQTPDNNCNARLELFVCSII